MMGPRVAAEFPEDLREDVRAALARTGGELTPAGLVATVRGMGRLIGDESARSLYEDLRREVEGAGPLEELLALPGVTDVLVNGCDQVFVDRGAGLEKVDWRFPDEESVRRLAQRLAASGGRRLDEASPAVDVRLPNGVRFHAVLAPIARPGTVLSLRLLHRQGDSLDVLAARGMVAPPMTELLRTMVRVRLSFLVSGATGTGKTTLLSALVAEMPESERVLLVEDSSELRPAHPHVVALEGRPANIEGAGAIELSTLVRQAMRMRPDRIVVGEVRGVEVVDLLMALNTGHRGGGGTIHANSAADVPTRIEALGLMAGMERAAVHAAMGSALDVLVHLTRGPEGRVVEEIAVLERGPDGWVRVRPAMTRTSGGEVCEGEALDALRIRS